MRELPQASKAGYARLAIAALLLVAVFAGLTALAAGIRATSWTSEAKVVYGSPSSDALLGRTSVSGDVDRLLATQAQVVVSDAVMSAAAATLGVDEATLVDSTEVSNVTDSNVLSISVSAESAAEAARRAQGVAEQYVATTRDQARQDLTAQSTALDTPISELRANITGIRKNGALADAVPLKASLTTLLQQQSELQAAATSETGPVRLLASAQTPSSPSSMSVTTAAVIGAGLGLVVLLGVGLVLARPGRGDGSAAPTS